MITPLGWLERVPSYKEMQENLANKDLTTFGFLGYPVLMASDILLYQPQFVPVGRISRRTSSSLVKLRAGSTSSTSLVNTKSYPSQKFCSHPRPSSPVPTAARCQRATATPSR